MLQQFVTRNTQALRHLKKSGDVATAHAAAGLHGFTLEKNAPNLARIDKSVALCGKANIAASP
jgi:hypothetical protein